MISVITPAALRTEADLTLPGEEAAEAPPRRRPAAEEQPRARGARRGRAAGRSGYPMAWLVAGLGNPDDELRRSRHNVGRAWSPRSSPRGKAPG